MKSLILAFLFISMSYTAYCSEVDSLLTVLNYELERKDIYVQEKEKRISSLKELRAFENLSLQQEFDINNKLHDEYKKYQIDSAIHYVKLNIKISGLLEDKYRLNEQQLNLASLYSTRGLYIDALNILKGIQKNKLDNKLKAAYYDSYSLLFRHYAQSSGIGDLYAQSDVYRDSLLMNLETASFEYNIVYVEKVLYKEQNGIRVQGLLHDLYNQVTPDSESYPLIAYLLGYSYELASKPELQMKYLILAAISDVKNAITDNASFQMLAILLYNKGKGDVDLAYKYNKKSLEDAIFCNVRYRTIDSSNTYPIITGRYQQKENEQKKTLEFFLILISLLSILVIFAFIYIYRQMKRVAKIRKELYRKNQALISLNDQLQTTNDQLEESNQVKIKYIAYSFDLCSSYIDKLERFKNNLKKKIQTKKIDEVSKLLSSNDFYSTELNDFYRNFDMIFLGIYPSFIEDFKLLLNNPDEIRIKQGDLLSPELRIFALIRLGITDSNRIANYLHYSLSTIYNYRSRIKNRSIVPQEEFEDRIMQIGMEVSRDQGFSISLFA